MSLSYEVKDGELIVRIKAPHPQVLPFYPTYDTKLPSPLAVEDYRRADNACGHTQRAFLNYWGIRSFIETDGTLGLEIGSGGVHDAFCLATDIVVSGESPVYGGKYENVQMRLSADDFSMFGTDTFSCVISNHVVEHIPCSQLKKPYGYPAWGSTYFAYLNSPQGKFHLRCNGREITKIIDDHWLRIVKPGGYIAGIFPDEGAAIEGGSSVFYQDPSHQHAWTAEGFMKNVIRELKTPIEIVEFDTFKNHFSTNFVLKKK